MKAVFSAWSERVCDRQNIIIWLSSSLAAGYAGPFGTYSGMTPIERFPFWTLVIGCSLFIGSLLMSLRDVYFSDADRNMSEFMIAPIFTCIFGPTLYLILNLHPASDGSALTLLEAMTAVLLISSVIAAVRLVLFSSFETEIEETRAADGPRLIKRLPGDDPGAVLRISGKDHFVEVTTDKGRYDVRMRLADAVAEMDGVEGFLTHRSHWIAKDAVETVERVKGRHYVVSADKARIPVSRTHLPKLEEAGLVA